MYVCARACACAFLSTARPQVRRGGLSRPGPYLDVVGGKHSAEVKDLEHGGSTVVRDAVALQNVLSDHHFPSQPALAKCSVKGKHVRNMARLTTAEPFVFFHAFCDGFHFSLLTVGTLNKDKIVIDKGGKGATGKMPTEHRQVRKDVFYSNSEYRIDLP